MLRVLVPGMGLLLVTGFVQSIHMEICCKTLSKDSEDREKQRDWETQNIFYSSYTCMHNIEFKMLNISGPYNS